MYTFASPPDTANFCKHPTALPMSFEFFEAQALINGVTKEEFLESSVAMESCKLEAGI